jgi:CO/xanthine dehydrogenase Mo-binding subunit
MHLADTVSRRAFVKGGALTVGFALLGIPDGADAQGASVPAKTLDPTAVDAYLAVNADGTVTVWSGKVDLGQGLRIAMPQIVAEELGIGLDKIKYIEGHTDSTPDQGRTAGSYGIARGGMQLRRAAATARLALVELGAKHFGTARDELVAADGGVRRKSGGPGVGFAELIGTRKFDLKLDPKAPLKDPATYTLVGKPLPHPDVVAKCTGTQNYMSDISVPGMVHGRVVRTPAVGATLRSVDESSVAHLTGVRVVRIKDFLAVVADDEWTAVRAARALKAEWTTTTGLPAQSDLVSFLRALPAKDETLVAKGTAAPAADAKTLKATYFWPLQSHGSIGPSCAIADVTAERATIWTASQGTHGDQSIFAKFLGLPRERVQLNYVLGSGCFGMNGHEDAAADAAILSRAVGRPVRVQWSREDELGFDPKGPAQLLDLAASIDAGGRILDWRTDLWLPRATGTGLTTLLAPVAAGLEPNPGFGAGMIAQNGDPPYAANRISVVCHWLADPILRPGSLRSPGKPANSFALESFVDELAAAAGLDPLAFRLQRLTDPRALEVTRRVGAMMNWQARPSPGPDRDAPVGRGRGLAYVHYKHDEAHVALGVEVAVERASGRIKVERVFCAHDCGQMINPDGVRAQVEGSILQTISRVMSEEVRFDRAGVTSTDWSSYPILTFSAAPAIEIDLLDRPRVPPVGAGEAACTCVGAAIGNAVFDATGVRLRTVPFTPERVKAAMANAT